MSKKRSTFKDHNLPNWHLVAYINIKITCIASWSIEARSSFLDVEIVVQEVVG